MSQRLPVNEFKWVEDTSEFNEDFIKRYSNESDVQYPEKLHDIHNDLPFLPERMKIEKVEKLISNLHDKIEYVIHLRDLRQALIYGLVLKKVHRAIKFNQE